MLFLTPGGNGNRDLTSHLANYCQCLLVMVGPYAPSSRHAVTVADLLLTSCARFLLAAMILLHCAVDSRFSSSRTCHDCAPSSTVRLSGGYGSLIIVTSIIHG